MFGNILDLFGTRPDPSSSGDSERQTRCPPNITLNLHGGRGVFDLLFVASCAGWIQFGMLMFTGYSVYHPTFSKLFTKDGQPVGRYAYPLMTVGTFLLTAGMVCCLAVIAGGSEYKEFVVPWQRRDRTPKARVLWLQRSQIVNDQTFNASVIFGAPKGVNHILAWQRVGKPLRILSLSAREVLTCMGVFYGLSGFICQFQGLRGLNWSASIAQLCSIALMTALRAWVQRTLHTIAPVTRQVRDQHEIDWLALWLVKRFENNGGLETPWPMNAYTVGMEAQDMKEWLKYRYLDNYQGPEEPRERVVWTISTSPKGSIEAGNCSDPERAQRTLEIRKRLAQLTPQWRGDSAKASISLATSISIILDALLSPDKNEKFSWSLPVRLNDSSFQTIKLEAFNKEKRWIVDANDIDAILSLWLFDVRERQTAIMANTANEDDDWVQQGAEYRNEVSRLLGPANIDFQRNVSLLIGVHVRELQVKTVDEVFVTQADLDFPGPIGFYSGWEHDAAHAGKPFSERKIFGKPWAII